MQALELLHSEFDIDLLLLDINMPRLDGFGVLEVMKQRNSAITDILLRQLVAATNRCPLSQARIPTRSGSSGPKAAGIDRSRRFLWNGAQNRKEAS